MRLFSDAGEYALRAVVWLSERPREPHKTREIAERIQAAPGYLVKVLQGLARAGILAASRGSTGGFTLIRDANDLTVLEVLNAVDPLQRIRRCPLGIEAHAGRLCAMHRHVDETLAAVEASFAGTAVGSLGGEAARASALCRVPSPGETGGPAKTSKGRRRRARPTRRRRS
jgi:Rrf2 family transcriptional regulator, nitric oxide-sensitive transcriptional repressor